MSINAFVGYKIANKNKVVIEFEKPETSIEVDVQDSGVVIEQVDTSIMTESITDGAFYKHVCSLYENIMKYNISNTEVQRELNNILMARMVATELSEQTWHIMFNNLMKTIPNNVNVIDYYYPLALYMHMKDCELVHCSDGESLVCDGLYEEFSNYTVESFQDYVVRRVNEMNINSMKDALYRLLGYGYSIEDVRPELERVYKFCTIPMCIDEEVWVMSFTKLLDTVNEYENVCEVYYDLANFIHQIECDYEHYINEFGMTECDMTKHLEV